MSNTIKPVYYELNGSPTTGLSVTATCKNVTNNTILFTDSACTEDPDIDGMYTIVCYVAPGSEYIITYNAGTDSVDNRKQAYTFAIPEEQVGRGGQTVVRSDLTKKDIKLIAEEVAKTLPEEQVFPDIEEIVSRQIKSLPVADLDLSEVIALLGGLKALTGDVGTKLDGLTTQDNLQDFHSDLSDKLEGLEVGVSGLVSIEGLDEYKKEQKELIKEFAAFLSFVEIIKQEDSKNDKLKRLIQKSFNKYTNG